MTQTLETQPLLMTVGKPAPNSNSSRQSRNQNQNQSRNQSRSRKLVEVEVAPNHSQGRSLSPAISPRRKLAVVPVVTKAAVTREVAIRAVVAPVAELVVVAHPPSPRNRLSSSRQPEIQIAILRV